MRLGQEATRALTENGMDSLQEPQNLGQENRRYLLRAERMRLGRGGVGGSEGDQEEEEEEEEKRFGGRLEVRDGLAGGGREELVKAVIGSADGFNVRARKSTQDRAVQLIFLVT